MNYEKKSLGIMGAIFVAGGMFQSLYAMPMFERQTGVSCMGCHTQQMPRLNKFGRKFMASGMTLSQKVSENNETSSYWEHVDIHTSVLLKSKYNRTYDKPDGKGLVDIEEDSTNDGEFSAARMLTWYLGGKVSSEVGALLKVGTRKEEGDSIEGKAIYAHALDDESYVGLVAFSTQSLGPFSGMEFYNTGLYKPLRMFDMKIYNNSVQKDKIGSQSATGIQLYYDADTLFADEDHLFLTVGMYVPAQDNTYYQMTDNLLPFARVAYEYVYQEFNYILGAFIIYGGDVVSSSEPLSIRRRTYGVDFQIEGTLWDREVTLASTYVLRNKIEYSGIYSGSDILDTEDRDDSGFSIQGAVTLSDAFVLKTSYMTYNDAYTYTGSNATLKINAKDIEYALGVGIDYGFTLGVPMKLAVEYALIEPNRSDIKRYKDFMVTLTLPF